MSANAKRERKRVFELLCAIGQASWVGDGTLRFPPPWTFARYRRCRDYLQEKVLNHEEGVRNRIVGGPALAGVILRLAAELRERR